MPPKPLRFLLLLLLLLFPSAPKTNTTPPKEPHSKRLKVRLTIRKEVLNKVMLQQETTVEVRNTLIQLLVVVMCRCLRGGRGDV